MERRTGASTAWLLASLFVLTLVGLATWAPLVVHTSTEALLQTLR